jgi:hypothetical protein
MKSPARPRRTGSVPAVLFFFLLGLAPWAVPPAAAQPGVRGGNERVPDFRAIDRAEGERRMENFRHQRLAGDYCFHFELVHLPRSGDPVVRRGRMWGSWNREGPVSRVLLQASPSSRPAGDGENLEFIVQNGPRSAVWMRRGGEGIFRALEGVGRFEPILPGINYSAFDLQMPFVFWEEFVYEGPGRALGRAAQLFLMIPPDGGAAEQAGIESVRLVLDESYDALLRAEVVGEDGNVRSSFRVRKFKRVQDQWIVRTVDLFDPAARDRTRFEVTAAATGITLDPRIFDPDTPPPPPDLPGAAFETL